jgi:hypothetical protein
MYEQANSNRNAAYSQHNSKQLTYVEHSKPVTIKNGVERMSNYQDRTSSKVLADDALHESISFSVNFASRFIRRALSDAEQ